MRLGKCRDAASTDHVGAVAVERGADGERTDDPQDQPRHESQRDPRGVLAAPMQRDQAGVGRAHRGANDQMHSQ